VGPDYIRVSIGTAVVLGLEVMKVDANPTTAYLMLYSDKRCLANCGFCPQARESKANNDMLSRILWPKYTFQEVKERFESLPKSKPFERICIQVINYRGFFDDLIETVAGLNQLEIPISVSVQPLNQSQLIQLHDLKVARVGIPLDAATGSIFYNVKGRGTNGTYVWEKHLETIRIAQNIFGKNNVSTHLIIGLGETEFEAVQFLQKMIDANVLPALFTFTPIKGTRFAKMPRPSLFRYRKVQLARYLLLQKRYRLEDFSFNEKGEIISFGISTEELESLIRSGTPFLTSGCSGCNRPYYNERPGETLYNYPRSLEQNEIDSILQLFRQKMR